MTAAVESLRRIISTRRSDHFTYVADAVGDFPLSRANYIYVFDTYGNQFLDLSAGDGVMVLGHQNPAVQDAVTHHLTSHQHTARSGEHVSDRVTAYAKALSKTFTDTLMYGGEGMRLDEKIPKQVLFCSSETEAHRAAKEMARKFTGRNGHPDEGPIPFWTFAMVGPDLVPGEQDKIRLQVDKAERAGAMVIVDETRTGFGRTGSLWAHEQYGIDPDITVLGGAGGGGFPFGAVVAGAHLFEALKPTGRLFGGSSVICQAGLATLEQITGPLLEHVRDVGHIFTDGVAELRAQFPDLIAGSRGLGLLQGLTLTSPGVAQKFHREAQAAGMLVRPPVDGRVIPITPPLVISEAEMHRLIDLISSVCLDWTEPL